MYFSSMVDGYDDLERFTEYIPNLKRVLVYLPARARLRPLVFLLLNRRPLSSRSRAPLPVLLCLHPRPLSPAG